MFYLIVLAVIFEVVGLMIKRFTILASVSIFECSINCVSDTLVNEQSDVCFPQNVLGPI